MPKNFHATPIQHAIINNQFIEASPLSDEKKKFLIRKVNCSVHLNPVEEEIQISDCHIYGNPYLPKATKWPVCSTCRKAMPCLFQINFFQAGYEILEKVKLFNFFFCFFCNPTNHSENGWKILTFEEILPDIKPVLMPSFSIPSDPGGLFSINSSQKPAKLKTVFTYDIPSPEFDSEVKTMFSDNISQYQDLMKKIRNTQKLTPRSMIGGHVQESVIREPHRCICGEKLIPVLKIISTDTSPFSIGKGGGIYLYACLKSNCETPNLYWWANAPEKEIQE